MLKAPPYYKVALSADRAFIEKSRAAAPILIAHGRTVYSWADCEATSALEARVLAHNAGLHGWIGQAENPVQAANAWGWGCKIVVGQLAALNDAQKDDIRDGKVLWIEEHFWNKMPWVKRDYQNLPVASGCLGIFNETGATFRSWLDYRAAGRVVPGDGCFRLEDLSDEDIRALP